jgi:hypothetical protein
MKPRKMTVDASKRDRERPAAFSKGGKGAPNKMLEEVPAEAAPAGRTGPTQKQAPGSLRARGGPQVRVGGLSVPAKGGRTGPG